MPTNGNGNSDELTHRDRQVIEQLDVDDSVPGEHHPDELEALRERNRELEAIVQDLQGAVQELEDELEAWKKTFASRLNELGAKVEGGDPANPRSGNYYEDLTILEKYAQMSDAERAELLDGSTTKQRAVLIYQNWTDWARNVPNGWLINTNHTRGKHGKAGIKIDLEQATGEDLQSVEVHRALRMVAKLSAKERDDVDVVTDEYGRMHITGGAFEYHEKVNPDATGHERKFKVLKLTHEDAITLP